MFSCGATLELFVKTTKKAFFSEAVSKIQTNKFDNLLSNVNFVKENLKDESRDQTKLYISLQDSESGRTDFVISIKPEDEKEALIHEKMELMEKA